jgi:hypothetical protein
MGSGMELEGSCCDGVPPRPVPPDSPLAPEKNCEEIWLGSEGDVRGTGCCVCSVVELAG